MMLPVEFLTVLLASSLADASISQGKFSNHYALPTGEHYTNRGVSAHVQALARGSALMPCDLSPAAPNDTVVLVVWYKDEHTPIYSYDTRATYSTTPKHWKDPGLETRAYFRTMTDPAVLNIENVSENDEGEYRCRIDFLKSPTKNLRVRLTVVVPPGSPKIIDETGKEVLSMAGPYEEGGEMKLTCIVTGGKPRPTIKWWREGKLVESMEVPSGFENARASQLVVRGLSRSDQHAAFTCQATNNNMSQPVSATTAIEIYFRPLSVQILNSNNPLSADRKSETTCQTFGSRPPAKIKWLMDGRELSAPHFNMSQRDSEDGNSSLSTLWFVPTREDNGRMLSCRANNELVHNGVEEATIKLSVFYIPICNLTLGSSLNPNDIEEGDDVYFECKVNANPWAYKVVWKHNGQTVQPSPKGRVIITKQDLAIRGVTRAEAGNYSCVASNVEGDGESKTVHLQIMYKPICRSEQKKVYGVGRHEDAKVLCQVEAYPAPDSFKWSFNNSAETIEVPPERYHSGSHHYSSTLTYKPISELDYGTVMCWANNLAGRQQEPCVFHIIAAGKPDPPYNCTIINMTNDSLVVECQEGFDGGQQQVFVLEVYDWKTGALQANVSATFPQFIVGGLDPGKVLKMVVYAANNRGRSESILLEGFTLKVAEKQTVVSMDARDQLEIAPVLGILVGIVTALLLVSVIVLGVMKIRAARRDGPGGGVSVSLRPGFLPVGKEKVTMPLRADTDDLFEKDDKNPDVIPANKDSDYQLGSAAQTPGPNHLNSLTATASSGGSPSSPAPSAPPMTNAYIQRTDKPYSGPATNEVTYAELTMVRPTTLDSSPSMKNGGQHYSSSTLPTRSDPTIYAQIDHARKASPLQSSRASPLISPVASLFPVVNKQPGLYHREVVTVRTPLMGCQQESCV